MNVYILISLYVLLTLDVIKGAVIGVNRYRSRSEQQQYLHRFGYLDAVRGSSSWRALGSRSGGAGFTAAVSLFQRKFHLSETGVVDVQTMRMMNAPRCGVPDFPMRTGPTERHPRPLQFRVTSYNTWRDSNIRYRIRNFTSDLSIVEQTTAIQQAFEIWEQQVPLSFTQSSGPDVHIDISFERGEHGDGDPFNDNDEQEHAHASLPEFGGDVHFNDHIQWRLDPQRGYDLLQVALHEIGHALGLVHSDVKGSIMHKTYQEHLSPVRLHDDDIAAIRTIYPPRGVDSATTMNPVQSFPPPNPPNSPRVATHNCVHKNPCNPTTMRGVHFYFPHDDPNKFVQCDNWGQCFEQNCGATLVWNTRVNTCTRP